MIRKKMVNLGLKALFTLFSLISLCVSATNIQITGNYSVPASFSSTDTLIFTKTTTEISYIILTQSLTLQQIQLCPNCYLLFNQGVTLNCGSIQLPSNQLCGFVFNGNSVVVTSSPINFYSQNSISVTSGVAVISSSIIISSATINVAVSSPTCVSIFFLRRKKQNLF